MATKAEEIYSRTHQLMDQGMSRTDAFKQIAEEMGRKYDSVRGSYYSHKLKAEGGGSRPTRTRRRETTLDAAVGDARAALERAIQDVDQEVEVARFRAEESQAEYEALQASADERKEAIGQRLQALQ